VAGDSSVAGAVVDSARAARFIDFRCGYCWHVPKRIDVERAQRLMKQGAQLIDVLPASIFIQEHLPHSRSLPLETMTSASLSDFDRTKPVLVYCFDQH
jgi:hypothetical protein